MKRQIWRHPPVARTPRRPARRGCGCLIPGLAACLLIMLGMLFLDLRPDLAAQGADALRAVAGDAVVAWLENTAFTLRDVAQQEAYRLGLVHAASPWAAEPAATPRPAPPRPTAAASASPTAAPQRGALRPTDQSMPPTAPAAAATPTPAPADWLPEPLPQGGTMAGAGQWSPYLRDAAGHVIAYRAFVQPDPDRPYVYAGVVAISIRSTRLHYVLGTEEPASPVKVARTGAIPSADLQGGAVLAAFNGGFKARHGHFGAMADGVTVLPPRDGFGTIALYRDGQIQIGAWGAGVRSSPGMLAWRQNGPLLIDHGAISPHTADQTSQDWGIILNGVTAVERSGVGISADGSVLYYVAGDTLTLPRLAAAFAMLHVESAMQLDINAIYVRFDTFQASAAGLRASPLLSAMRGDGQRYLHPWTRDFFYLTARGDSAS